METKGIINKHNTTHKSYQLLTAWVSKDDRSNLETSLLAMSLHMQPTLGLVYFQNTCNNNNKSLFYVKKFRRKLLPLNAVKTGNWFWFMSPRVAAQMLFCFLFVRSVIGWNHPMKALGWVTPVLQCAHVHRLLLAARGRRSRVPSMMLWNLSFHKFKNTNFKTLHFISFIYILHYICFI